MGLKLSRQQRQLLLDWAEEAGEDECCGLLLGQFGSVERVELTKNVAEKPNSNFEIDPFALILAEKASRNGGPEILGYFHSHPNGRNTPSAKDASSAMADGRCWLIVAKDEVTAWRPVGNGPGQPVIFQAERLDWG